MWRVKGSNLRSSRDGLQTYVSKAVTCSYADILDLLDAYATDEGAGPHSKPADSGFESLAART